MSMLSLIQRFAEEINVNTPGQVMGTTDPQTKQIKALLQKEVDDLAGRGDWQELTNEATHTTLALEDQGTIKSIASNGFRYIKNGTIWDRDLRLPVYVIDGTDWQQVKAIAVTGPRYQARIRGGDLISNPVPAAGHTWAFEYITWNALTDSTGVTQKQYFTADSDLMLLPEPIIEAGLQWRWKKQKGFEYAEDFRSYEVMVANGLARNNMRRTLDMGMRQYTPQPKIFVNDGNWGV